MQRCDQRKQSGLFNRLKTLVNNLNLLEQIFRPKSLDALAHTSRAYIKRSEVNIGAHFVDFEDDITNIKQAKSYFSPFTQVGSFSRVRLIDISRSIELLPYFEITLSRTFIGTTYLYIIGAL